MYTLIIKPHAIETAQQAYNWYEEQQNGLGEIFIKEIENCLDKIETWPISYAKVKSNFRQIIVRTFPYVIVFEINGNEVIVYTIFHTSRSPRKKFKK
jgi:toxin ParE1/3/4